MRFVIADDSRIPRDFARRILTEAGHTVVVAASNGAEAVEACRTHRPEVALLDVSMPVMTGSEAAHAIKAEGTASHVVMASSNSQDAIVQQLAEIGVGFIAKPYQDTQLLSELAALIPGLA